MLKRTFSIVATAALVLALAAPAFARVTQVHHPFTLHFARVTLNRATHQVFRSAGLTSLTPRIERCYWSTPVVATCVLHGPSLISGGEHTYRLHFGISDIYS